MEREIIVAKGVFSKLKITLDEQTNHNLGMITPENNPLAKIQDKLETLLTEFEDEYFRLNKESRDDKE